MGQCLLWRQKWVAYFKLFFGTRSRCYSFIYAIPISQRTTELVCEIGFVFVFFSWFFFKYIFICMPYFEAIRFRYGIWKHMRGKNNQHHLKIFCNGRIEQKKLGNKFKMTSVACVWCSILISTSRFDHNFNHSIECEESIFGLWRSNNFSQFFFVHDVPAKECAVCRNQSSIARSLTFF